MDVLECRPRSGKDWGHFKNLETEKMNPFSGTGGSMSISSNRLAYVFGFRGPSVTSDTACSSSLVALDMAAANIGRGRCAAALAAGVNMKLGLTSDLNKSFMGVILITVTVSLFYYCILWPCFFVKPQKSAS